MARQWTVADSTRAISADLGYVNGKLVPKSQARAVNITLRAVAKAYRARKGAEAGVSQRVIGKRMTTEKATPRKPEGAVNLVSARIRAITTNYRHTQSGVRFGKFRERGAFVRMMQRGYTGVFRRTGEFKVMSAGSYSGQRREVIREQYIELKVPERDLQRLGDSISAERFPREFTRDLIVRLRGTVRTR